MEGVTACAGACCVGVVDGEALLFDGVFEVDGGAVEVGCAHLVDDDLYAVEVADCVAVEDALVEVELVDEAGAAARLDGDAQAQVVAAFLFEECADLGLCDLGEGDAVGGQFGGGFSLVLSFVVLIARVGRVRCFGRFSLHDTRRGEFLTTWVVSVCVWAFTVILLLGYRIYGGGGGEGVRGLIGWSADRSPALVSQPLGGGLLPCLVFCATALRRAGGLVACPAHRGALGRFFDA